MPPRKSSRAPKDWNATDIAPPPADTKTLPCKHCGATYLDYPAGRYAHEKVFGHPPPKPRTPRNNTAGDHQ